MFTAIKTLPGTISSDLSSVASSLKTSTLSAIDTVGNTITGTVSSGYKEVTNAFGSVSSKITGALGTVSNGLHTAFSFISAFGAKLGFILEIVGITIAAIVIVGLILYFGVMRRESSMVPGESHI
jgi:phage-related protein